MDDPFARLSLIIARRPWLVVGIWVVILLPCAALFARADTVAKTSGFQLPQTQAAEASVVLEREFSASAGSGAGVVYHSRTKTVDDGVYRNQVNAAAKRIRSTSGVRSIVTFFDTQDPGLVSRDRHTTLALISFTSDDPKLVSKVRDQLRSPRPTSGLSAYVTGNLAVQQDVFATSQDDLRRFELIAFPVLLILLLLVFRTAVAATMPLLLGACSVTMGTALIALIGSVMDVSIFALNVASMLGLGLGIDFSLIIITRFRHELETGLERSEALARTMATAGRSILYSGITVMLSMLVMTLFMYDFMILRSISLAVTLVAFTSLLSALTLLPAVLTLLGRRVEWLRVVPSRRRAAQAGPGTWYRLSHAIMRRPWLWLVASLLVLAALAVPVRNITTGVKTFDDLPAAAESVRGARVMSAAFGPGRLTPIEVVLQPGKNGVWRPDFLGALQQLTNRAAADPRAQQVQSLSTVAQGAGIAKSKFTSLRRQTITANPKLAQKATQVVNVNRGNDVALVTIVPRYEEFTPQNLAFVRDLRDKIIPATPKLAAFKASVGGETANSIDFNGMVYGRFPLIVAMVLLMTFIILLMFFQSITLPLKAIFMNLATMLATYGVLVVLFLDGWGSGLFGLPKERMLDLVTPVIVYAILFALSTDYEVFMLSRVKEYYHQMRNNTEAVAAGLQSTGGMITAAGLILIATFGSFATGQVTTLKELGLGLGIGVLLDSTIVRIVMVPATMRLMGDRNWWMPGWLKAIVPELREAPTLQPAEAIAAGIGVPSGSLSSAGPTAAASLATGPVAMAPVATSREPRAVGGESAAQSSQLTATHGVLRPRGASVGADVIVLPQTKPLRMGRDRANELQLFDPLISRFHARIDYVDGRYVLTDLGSKNGTYIDLQELPPYQRIPLQPGNIIRIGTFDRVTFAFESSASSYQPPDRRLKTDD